MNISGISNNSYFSNVQYRVTGSYNSSGQLNAQQTDEPGQGRPPKGKGPKGPGGPGGPGGPQGRRPKGPNLDTDGDGSWSTSEVEEYASYSTSTIGIELDAEDIMNTYDTNEDGMISSEERGALASDNAFKLPSPKEVMESMRSQNTNFSINNEQETTTTTNNTNTYMINQLIAAYNQTNNNLNLDDYVSTVSYKV